MSKVFTFSLLTLIGAATVGAELSAPMGKGLESLDFPYADSFLVSGKYENSYADEHLTGEMARYVFSIVMPDGGYELDTARQIVSYLPAGYMVTTDSAGLQHDYRSVVDVGGNVSIETRRRMYDSQGRPVAELGVSMVQGSPAVGQETVYDTLMWVWTHSGCADDKESDTLRSWSVDSRGRCDTAIVALYDGNSSHPTGLVDKIVWQGDYPSKALRLLGKDTVARDEYTVDAQGRVRQVLSYTKEGSAWVLRETHSFEYVGSRLDRVVLVGEAGTGMEQRLEFRSTKGGTGISSTRREKSDWLGARCDGRTASFANALGEPVVVELVDSRGRMLDRMPVSGGATVSWMVTESGPVFWRATAKGHHAEGILPSVR